MPRRTQAGVAFPSPLVMLSVVAIAMAGIAFVATQDQPELERRIETAATSPTPTPSASPDSAAGDRDRRKKQKKAEPRVQRSEVYVVVFNNSGIRGLAATTAAKATQVGWQVVGEDNWYGTIPASTVYYPQRLAAAGKLLALDLGIKRVQPAIESMPLDRLTVVLTADAA